MVTVRSLVLFTIPLYWSEQFDQSCCSCPIRKTHTGKFIRAEIEWVGVGS